MRRARSRIQHWRHGSRCRWQPVRAGSRAGRGVIGEISLCDGRRSCTAGRLELRHLSPRRSDIEWFRGAGDGDGDGHSFARDLQERRRRRQEQDRIGQDVKGRLTGQLMGLGSSRSFVFQSPTRYSLSLIRDLSNIPPSQHLPLGKDVRRSYPMSFPLFNLP